MQMLIRGILSALALFLTVKAGQVLGLHFILAPGVHGLQGLLMMTVLLGAANAVLRPVVQMIALPVTCLTFGLFSFVINGFMFWLAGQFATGFKVNGYLAPLFGSIVMGIISGALNTLIVPRRERN